MDYIKVEDYSYLTNAKKEIMDKSDEYERRFMELKQAVEKMSYEGDDKKEFLKAVESFMPDIKKMRAAMEGYALALEKTANDLQTAQNDLKHEAGNLNRGNY